MPIATIAARGPSTDARSGGVVEGGRVSGGRRVAAAVVDGALLVASLGWALTFEFALWADEAMAWVVVVWLLGVAPLYFGLYHAYGTGATPGQQDLGLAVRDARTHETAGFRRGVAGSLVGVLEIVTVLPALVDALIVVSGGRSLRERLLGLETVPFALRGAQRPLPTTAEAVAPLFTSTGPITRRRRAQALVGRNMARVFGPVLGAYLLMIGLSVVFGSLVLLDAGEEWEAYGVWFVYTSLLFLSGVYWTQAVVVLAVESVRTADPAGVVAVIRAATSRLNGLAATLLLLVSVVAAVLALAFVGIGALGVLLALPFVLGRLALTVPAIVLEDMRVTEAARASWQRTRGHTWRLGGAVILCGLLVQLGVVVALGAGMAVAAPAMGDETSAAALVAASTLALAIAAVPTALLLAYLGAWWTLAYHDLRQRDPAETLDAASTEA